MSNCEIRCWMVGLTDGGGDFSTDTFREVNNELPGKLDEIGGEFARLNHLVIVTPQGSGFEVHMVLPPESKLRDDKTQTLLIEWIEARMFEIQLKESQKPSD